MAAGDVLLDADGNVILDDSGNVVLDDGAGNDCCCATAPVTGYVQARNCYDDSDADLWFEYHNSDNTIVTTAAASTALPFYFEKDGYYYYVPEFPIESDTPGTMADGYVVQTGCPTGGGSCCGSDNTYTFLGISSTCIHYGASYYSTSLDLNHQFCGPLTSVGGSPPNCRAIGLYEPSVPNTLATTYRTDATCTTVYSTLSVGRVTWTIETSDRFDGSYNFRVTGGVEATDTLGHTDNFTFFDSGFLIVSDLCQSPIVASNTTGAGGYMIFYPGCV